MSRICARCQTSLESHERCPDHPDIEPRPDHAGTVLQGFRVHRMIASSALGDVWAGGDGNRIVAVKFVAAGQGSADADRRLLRAAWQNADLEGSHIARIVGSGRVDDNIAFRISDHAEGRPLAGPLPPVRAARIGAQVCRALNLAHGRGSLHLNLKPNNVLVDDDAVVVCDFGLRRALRMADTVAASTGLFSAPEVTPETVGDHRSDLYSLGALLYLAVTGQPPYPEGAIGATEPPPIDARFGPLSELVERLLATDPSRRPSSAASVLATLETLAAPQAPPVRLTPAPTPIPPPRSVAPTPARPPTPTPTPRTAPVPYEPTPTPTPTFVEQRRGDPPALLLPLVLLTAMVMLVIWWASPDADRRFERVVVANDAPDVAPQTVAALARDAALPDAAPTPSPKPPRVRVRVVAQPDASLPVVQAPTVKIESTPEGAVVYCDGIRVGNTPYEGETSPGKHRYTLRLGGYAPATVALDLDPGARLVRHFTLRREAPAEPPPTEPVAADPPPKARPKKPKPKPRVKLIGMESTPEPARKPERVKMLGAD